MSVNTNKWLKFFTEAGLPLSVATNYAIIFTNHRIQNDMLSDLTKEILYDMGIKTMGDVIAILRHAKSVDHKTTRDQLLGRPAVEGEAVKQIRPTLPANNQTTRPLNHRFKTISAPDSTQKPSSTSNVISLKRKAQTSGVVTTNPKVKKVMVSEEDEEEEDYQLIDEDINDLDINNGLQRLQNKSVFNRLGSDKTSDNNSTIFNRLGSGLNSSPTKRRVTMSGNSITTHSKPNIIKLNNNNIKTTNRLSLNIVPKKTIAAPNSSGVSSTGMRSSRIDSLSVRERIGLNPNSHSISTSRLVVNRSVAANRHNASSSVLEAKRIAMRRAIDSKPKTISLRKNIFDRLGPISL